MLAFNCYPIVCREYDVMIRKADIVVIGSGGLGAATAYYLSKRGGLSIALVDKHDIGSQTQPTASSVP
jgi:glycine/D-amino acid oxidase-like deaminating enzyme